MTDEEERAELLAWFGRTGTSDSMMRLLPNETTATLRSIKKSGEDQVDRFERAGFFDEQMRDQRAAMIARIEAATGPDPALATELTRVLEATIAALPSLVGTPGFLDDTGAPH